MYINVLYIVSLGLAYERLGNAMHFKAQTIYQKWYRISIAIAIAIAITMTILQQNMEHSIVCEQLYVFISVLNEWKMKIERNWKKKTKEKKRNVHLLRKKASGSQP